MGQKMTQDDMEAMLRQRAFEFLVRFSDDVLETAANRMSSETAYNLLRGLSYEEYALVVRKVLTTTVLGSAQ